MENIKISASIVVYKEDPNILKKSITSFLSLNFIKTLVIIDNSPVDNLKSICESFDNIIYIHSDKNLGFGKAHNLAFEYVDKKSDIHLILNPDIYFDSKEIEDFINWFFYSDSVLAIPQVLYPDGSLQYVARKLPTFSSLLKRQFVKNSDTFKIENKVTEIPFANGCFFAFKSQVFSELNGFDERFFMYMEDVDIWIRAKKYGKTVINPNFKIYHYFRKGSKKNIKLFLYHINSIIKYFFKYQELI